MKAQPMVQQRDFEGRVILVCGVARGGIGGATVRQLAQRGAILACVDKDQATLDASLADILPHAPQSTGFVADLTKAVQTKDLVDSVVAHFGRLDGVANIAGGTRAGEWMALDEVSDESFEETCALNLAYAFRISRDAARSMIKRQAPAPIVNVSSISALNSAPMHGVYGAVKAGLIALTRTMAFEWSKYAIRVNAVSPGAVPSERVVSKKLRPEDVQCDDAPSDILQTTTDEVAQAIIFLLSDQASGISGHNLVVDSGISTRNAVLALRMDGRKAGA